MLYHAKRIFSAATVLALTLLILPMGVDAQTPQQGTPDEPDREELTEFVKAMIDVNEIQEEMEQALAGVDNPEQANQIQQQANAEMVAVLEEHDMTPERYSEIAMLLNVDPELNEQFQEIHEEILEEREGVGVLH
jgi:hypothetical protein